MTDIASLNLLVDKWLDIDFELERVVNSPSPFKYIFANNTRLGSRIHYMSKSRPFLIPFKVDNFIIRIGYYHEDFRSR